MFGTQKQRLAHSHAGGVKGRTAEMEWAVERSGT